MASFQDVIGQEMIKEHFQNAIQNDKVSHAYIINGEVGSGKEFIASIFAMTLQCEAGGINPCNQCHSCKMAETKNHPDIIFVPHEKPNSIGVEDIRVHINNQMEIKPYSGKYKIYIVPEAEKMTPQAQNALLKTLEEPPSYGVIIMLTTNADKMLPTILSRCVVLQMHPVKDSVIKEYLMREMQMPDYKANVCAAFARGNMGKARMLAGSEDFDNIKDDAVTLMKYVYDMELSEVVKAIKKIQEYKFDIDTYLDILYIWYRDVLLFKATRDINALIFKEEIPYIKKAAGRSTYEGIEIIVDALETARARLKANVNFDLTMELLFLTIKENSRE